MHYATLCVVIFRGGEKVTDNELLLAISDLMVKKLKPIDKKFKEEGFTETEYTFCINKYRKIREKILQSVKCSVILCCDNKVV